MANTKAGSVAFTLWMAIVCGFWLGIAGLVVGIVLDIFTGIHFLGSSSFNLMIAGAIVGAIGGGLIFGIEAAAGHAKEANAEREREVRAREEGERSRRDQLNGTAAQARNACNEAVQAFEQLPADLSNARGWSAEARQHFSQHAYSPFWQSVEHAYDCLGHYNQRLTRIAQLLRQHAEAVRSYIRQGGTERLPAFPVQLDAANATQAAETITRTLNKIVYEAQRDAVFAQIWEQRRTTSAVIAGFANLESAVSRMSSSLNSSINSLAAEVRGVGAEVSQASTRAGLHGNAQLDAQKELTAKVDKAVYYLREEEKRALRL
ncbi:hypothetical protein [Microbacterium sp. MRS-1]|mgnify:CR=1 FL=1|uniref:hypothetical protein n=1 Tax=Microbacterium sp. MRS-1 TaxID=1451261 RepID=UPI0012DEF82B|nr:hypothetical protein [Microbacterium sp. MRS-1]